MSLESPPPAPSLSDYSQALDRLQRQAAYRRAVMSCGLGGSFEDILGEEQERRDRELLEVWERHHGPGWVGY